MSYCLTKNLATEFKKRLKTGEINPENLIELGSEGRHKYFKNFLGEDNAKNVNALFESKLLLKNQQQGIINWAKTVTGIKPEVRRDLISRVEKMTKILNPAEEKAFLSDLAEKKLGVHIDVEEAKKIFELSQKVSETKKDIEGLPDGDPKKIEYGAAKVALESYVSDLKNEANKTKPIEYLNPITSINKIAGLAKSLKASLDNSAIFRQGWKVLFTNPKIWAENAWKSFGYIKDQLRGKDVMSAIKADIYSRENALNGNYQKMKVDVGMNEEAFPDTLPEKIPLFGRIYKSSEVAYNGFLTRLRADLADRYIEIGENKGINLSETELRARGKIINSLTGRGSLGSLEQAGKVVNNVFFSPKFMKSQFDFLTAHTLDSGMTSSTRKTAALNLLKTITGIAAIMATAKALKPDSIELDPRSSDFGKIRVGDTRFDISGGMSSLVTLASRLIMQSSKSSTSGNITQLGTGFGQTSGIDVVENFLENKLSPAASVVKDLINQKDFNGDPITIQGELSNFLVPLPITTYQELASNPNSANIIVSMIADALGIATNTYSGKPADPLKQLQDEKKAKRDAAYEKISNPDGTKNIDAYRSATTDERKLYNEAVSSKKAAETKKNNDQLLKENFTIYKDMMRLKYQNPEEYKQQYQKLNAEQKKGLKTFLTRFE